MSGCAARYREFAPCPALRAFVSRLFCFSVPAAEDEPGPALLREIRFGPGDCFSSPLFADGHASVVFTFGTGYRVHGLWEPRPRGPSGHLIGPMTVARPASVGTKIRQVGAYFRPARVGAFTGVPAPELADRVTAAADLWGPSAADLEQRLAEAGNDARRVAVLESALLARLRPRAASLDLAGLADWIVRRSGSVRIEQLAHAAGVSRQHLTRVFREETGVSPKLYSRLARFRAALAHAGSGRQRDWAGVAARLGYADQSHLIAEVRRFSGLTPGDLTRQQRFHPFIEDSAKPPGDLL